MNAVRTLEKIQNERLKRAQIEAAELELHRLGYVKSKCTKCNGGRVIYDPELHKHCFECDACEGDGEIWTVKDN